MKLSIIIVNYNVKYFLEQCIHSVYKALNNLQAEVFVVDNDSVDGSCAMVRKKFPEVKLIENQDNLGFSVANNQAIRISKGEYVLLLNPDTVVEEDTFDKVVAFMDSHPDAGGLGVKMIDGKGAFLPESKRGLPTPMVSFFKIFGFSKLFPKSKLFSRYHMGHLSNNEVHEIDVLAGAFMLMRKETLDKVGLLDEDYFMYGEDIDLSYRITKGGYKNYYFPDTTIIHYKGESTKKGSINYVKVFYNAMIIFTGKHFSKKNAQIYAFAINVAIYLRAFFAIISQCFKRLFLPLLDAITIFSGFWFLAPLWGNYRFGDSAYYESSYFLFAVPFFIFLWIISIYFLGGYERPMRLANVIKGIIFGSGIILIIYALLPETLRFSRALIIFGMVWELFWLILYRFIFHVLNFNGLKFDFGRKLRIALVGSDKEAQRVKNILVHSAPNSYFVGIINHKEKHADDTYLGGIHQLKQIITINKVNELVFCAQDISAQRIIKEMLNLEGESVTYKIAPPQSLSIIGSNSIDTAGDLYVVDFNTILKPASVRNKRLFDLIAALIILLLMPVLILFVPHRWSLLNNVFYVLFGIKTWVGFFYREDVDISNLPTIKSAVISWVLVKNEHNSSSKNIEKINLMYAKNYKISNDILILFKGVCLLGRT